MEVETPVELQVSSETPVYIEEVEESDLSPSELPVLEEKQNLAADKLSLNENTTSETLPASSNEVETKGVVKNTSNNKDEDNKTISTKSKKKEDKSIEYILRALSSLSTPEEKLAALCKKYADLHEEHRVLQSSFKQQQRKMTVVTREKEQLQSEHSKAIMTKSKLESLCRELQKHNKLIKEESLQRAKEEDEKRREISAKFQTTIGEIQNQLTDNHDKNIKLREENMELAGKLKKFLEQYEIREQQLEKLMKHRELEHQLSDAKLQQAAAILKEEQEHNLKEKELLLLQTTEGQKKNSLLEAQLVMYKDRYEEFQATINRSNDMFQKLKAEMDKMGKRIKKLEKEGASWRSKWEGSNKALLEMAEEKTRSDKEKHLLQSKIQKLESLCRALQAELHGKKDLTVVTEQDDQVTETVSQPDESSNDIKDDQTVDEPATQTSDSQASEACTSMEEPVVPVQFDNQQETEIQQVPTKEQPEPICQQEPKNDQKTYDKQEPSCPSCNDELCNLEKS